MQHLEVVASREAGQWSTDQPAATHPLLNTHVCVQPACDNLCYDTGYKYIIEVCNYSCMNGYRDHAQWGIVRSDERIPGLEEEGCDM